MTTVIWLERDNVMGAPLPQQYGATEHGQRFVMVREHACGRGTWRVSVFPHGNQDKAIEVVAGSERQAKRWVERWAAKRTISYPVPERKRMPHEGELKPRKPKGAEDRS
ncbi:MULTISPECIES: hypothetical protein [Luteibacter]|uniref:hypothetical protein n=1 Tax=Luteibacter TaxID=242605 RepID=UPI00055E224F|nr:MULTISPECIES: hypothetical protein [unclassified Luteibacter]